MSLIEVLLLLLGAAILTAGYLIPARKREASETFSQIQEQQVRELIEKEMEDARGEIEDIVDETVDYSVEKAERAMERLSNEKIMAINEYSDTVLQEIHKNHEEAVFLYDMLNSKHDTMKSTVSDAGKVLAEVKQTLQDAQITAKEVRESAATPVVNEPAEEPERPVQAEGGFVPIQPVEIQDMNAVLATPVYEEHFADEEIGSGGEEAASKAPARRKKDTGEGKRKKASSGAEASGHVSPDIQLHKGESAGGNNNERILDMHKAGKSNMAIAKELGLGIGEVKLVIDLYKGIGG